MIDVYISPNELEIEKIYSQTTLPANGCVNIFVGTVRENNRGRKVKYLNFESYREMALKEMESIAKSALKKWDIMNITIHHREGKVGVGEIAVIIAVSALHRDHSINATHYIIDTLKLVVPIWKKEVFEGGEEWVSAHP